MTRAAASAMPTHQPRKRFGQNFLVDPHYIARIVDAIAPAPGDNLVEIGPGLAALTGALLARAGHLTAVEIDRDLAARLANDFPPAQLTLFVADALEFDFGTLGARLRVVGNLPYNISSPLLFHLAQYEACIEDLHVMLQKEVVARMAAAPATADYGRLSVMLQARFAVTRLFVVPPGAFRPAPNVDSAVARLVPLGARRPLISDDALFARVVAAAFGQRRKTMKNALSGICGADALAAAGIEPGARGETLAVADFVRLANSLAPAAVTTPDPAAPAAPRSARSSAAPSRRARE
jgi:16S rRNA (adenine1518-N6/adenine1519-N6)-dimethyltransferase